MMTTVREIEERILADLKGRHELITISISQIEKSLSEPPYESHLDYDEIRMEAEYTIVLFDQLEQERDRRTSIDS